MADTPQGNQQRQNNGQQPPRQPQPQPQAPTATPAAPPENPVTGAPAAPQTPSGQQQLTYVPSEGDPHSVTWRKRTFAANVPVVVDDLDMIEAARGNSRFIVGDFKAGMMPPKVNEIPTSPTGYRLHVMQWMRDVVSVDQLVEQWGKDRALRGACDVGADDISYLGTLLDPKMRELQRRDGLSDQQLASVWIKHGFLEIPWRT